MMLKNSKNAEALYKHVKTVVTNDTTMKYFKKNTLTKEMLKTVLREVL